MPWDGNKVGNTKNQPRNSIPNIHFRAKYNWLKRHIILKCNYVKVENWGTLVSFTTNKNLESKITSKTTCGSSTHPWIHDFVSKVLQQWIVSRRHPATRTSHPLPHFYSRTNIGTIAQSCKTHRRELSIKIDKSENNEIFGSSITHCKLSCFRLQFERERKVKQTRLHGEGCLGRLDLEARRTMPRNQAFGLRPFKWKWFRPPILFFFGWNDITLKQTEQRLCVYIHNSLWAQINVSWMTLNFQSAVRILSKK